MLSPLKHLKFKTTLLSPKRGNLPLAESWASADSPVQKKLSEISNELSIHKNTGLTLTVGYEKLLL